MAKKYRALIFGGTTEGRDIAYRLSRMGMECTVCVATEYGEYTMGLGEREENIKVHVGRMDVDEMCSFITEGKFDPIVDATHPYAAEVSENIRRAAADTGVFLIRFSREVRSTFKDKENYERLKFFPTFEDCIKALEKTSGNILFTTGIKDISVSLPGEMIKRSYARILPGIESIRAAEKAGFSRSHIIAIQGPFSTRMNKAMIEEYDIRTMVSKASGDAGGYGEKLMAAKATETDIYVIRPEEAEDADLKGGAKKELYVRFYNISECTGFISKRYGILPKDALIRVSLVGMGMGDEDLMTLEAHRALSGQDVYFGSPRLMALLPENVVKYPLYEPDGVLKQLRKMVLDNPNVSLKAAVLFSGDTGFYSGAKKMSAAIKAFSDNSGIETEIKYYPGMSSLSYFSSKVGISYDNAVILSHHGRSANVISEIMMNRKVFLLSSDAAELKVISGKLKDAGLSGITIHAGYDLSSDEEKILTIKAEEYDVLPDNGICCAFFINDTELLPVTPSLGDRFFLRGDSPMTKEEVRMVSICKLKLPRDAVLYDVGSGTGSIAVECARLSNDMRVYAIESRKEAAALIASNAARAGLENVKVINAPAPAAFKELESPGYVFIGGSGGRLKEIVEAIAAKKQGRIRFVINAVTMETLVTIVGLMDELKATDTEVVGLQVSRSAKKGRYHMMKSENQIYIAAFEI